MLLPPGERGGGLGKTVSHILPEFYVTQGLPGAFFRLPGCADTQRAQGEQHIFLYGTGKDGWILKYHTHAPAQFRQRWRTVFSLSGIDRQGSGAEIQAYLPPRVSQPGNSSFNRLNARRKVVFPDPDRPRIAVSPCAGKVPERSRMTTCPPKAMERLPMRARWGMRDPYFCSQASRRCWRSSGA